MIELRQSFMRLGRNERVCTKEMGLHSDKERKEEEMWRFGEGSWGHSGGAVACGWTREGLSSVGSSQVQVFPLLTGWAVRATDGGLWPRQGALQSPVKQTYLLQAAVAESRGRWGAGVGRRRRAGHGEEPREAGKAKHLHRWVTATGILEESYIRCYSWTSNISQTFSFGLVMERSGLPGMPRMKTLQS